MSYVAGILPVQHVIIRVSQWQRIQVKIAAAEGYPDKIWLTFFIVAEHLVLGLLFFCEAL